MGMSNNSIDLREGAMKLDDGARESYRGTMVRICDSIVVSGRSCRTKLTIVRLRFNKSRNAVHVTVRPSDS
jgi:hypothetical protein